MNVFEDLIEELRDENLLEETVIDVNGSRNAPATRMARSEGDFAVSSAQPESDAETERDFFRKRAIDEISSLQMVEHVLTGVEREYMKIVPNAFDDFNVKKTSQCLFEGCRE